jgi:site-specific DNA recombinase
MTTPQKTAAIYARFSTDLQKDSSIEDQFATCEAAAKREGFKVTSRFSDRAKSGTSLYERDGALELMVAAKARKFDVVIVESLSRLARDQEDIHGLFKRLKHAQVALHTVSDGEANAMKITVRGLMDSDFIENLAKQVRRGLNGRARL